MLSDLRSKAAPGGKVRWGRALEREERGLVRASVGPDLPAQGGPDLLPVS